MIATTGDYLKLHFIVFLWGFTAILGLLISIPAVEMVLYRTLLAAIGMAVVIYWKKGNLHVDNSERLKLLLIGIIVSFHWLAFFGSGRVANASVSLVGFATNSLWAALLEPLMNRKRIKAFELVLGLVVIAGLYVIFSFDFQYKLGLALGVAAGFSAALFAVLNARMVRRVDAYTITFYEMTGAFIGTALVLPAFQYFFNQGDPVNLIPSAMDWLYLAALSWICTVYAFSTGVKLMKKLSVFFIQLTLNLEPVYGIIMALMIFGNREKMTSNFYIGTAIIIGAVLLYPSLKRRYDKPEFMP
ncbi:MAG: DMT family transporter [Cyclobacteriaceae bacterium]|jgi:drug/metabolite transporter (DMT)-like permease|nr:DMT family transporter [Cyclobacteriaceae bacterium]